MSPDTIALIESAIDARRVIYFTRRSNGRPCAVLPMRFASEHLVYIDAASAERGRVAVADMTRIEVQR